MMNIKKIQAIVGSCFLLIIVITVCIAATLFIDIEKNKNQQNKVDFNKEENLEQNLKLDQEPDLVTEQEVVFSDRILMRSNWISEDISDRINVLKRFLSQPHIVENGIQSYVMVVPLRIGLEDAFSEEEKYLELVKKENMRLHSLEESVLSAIDNLAIPIPLLDTLYRHRSEYIFYRTDPAWTAHGAYYGAQEFLNVAGLQSFLLDSFQESAKSTTFGRLKKQYKAKDLQYTYLYQNYNPLVKQIGTEKKSPMISITRAGTGCFIGNDSRAYEIDGLSKNDRVLMVLGKENAAVFIPWMVTQFEKIIYINLSLISMNDFELESFFPKYKITDLLFVEDAESIVSSQRKSALNNLTQDNSNKRN